MTNNQFDFFSAILLWLLPWPPGSPGVNAVGMMGCVPSSGLFPGHLDVILRTLKLMCIEVSQNWLLLRGF